MAASVPPAENHVDKRFLEFHEGEAGDHLDIDQCVIGLWHDVAMAMPYQFLDLAHPAAEMVPTAASRAALHGLVTQQAIANFDG
ncbi:hypothetical protein RCCGE510_07906 [Rhizobium sp. CCGE 510]|nr:hypothetical protein RCCGE510_07906 [Rhizobium sp. CCGE 510]